MPMPSFDEIQDYGIVIKDTTMHFKITKCNISNANVGILIENVSCNTAYITELDTEILIQSHIFQIKTIPNDKNIDSYLLLYLLNLDLVQEQIQAITFIQGTIATIGNRIMDVVLPIPTNIEKRTEISQTIKKIMNDKVNIRKKIKNLSLEF